MISRWVLEKILGWKVFWLVTRVHAHGTWEKKI